MVSSAWQYNKPDYKIIGLIIMCQNKFIKNL